MFGRILRILRLLETRLWPSITDRLCLWFTRLLFSSVILVSFARNLGPKGNGSPAPRARVSGC